MGGSENVKIIPKLVMLSLASGCSDSGRCWGCQDRVDIAKITAGEGGVGGTVEITAKCRRVDIIRSA